MADDYEYFIEVPEGHTEDRPDGLWRRVDERWEFLSLIDWSWHSTYERVPPPRPEWLGSVYRRVDADRATELAADRQRWITYWAKYHDKPRAGDRARTVLRRRRSPELVFDEAFARGNVWIRTSSVVEGLQGRGVDAPYLVELSADEAERTIQEIRGVSGATEL